MKRFLQLSLLALVAMVMLAACGNDEKASGSNGKDKDGKLKVVTSFTILADMAEEIGQDKVTVHNLVPTGTDPHEYEPLPKDTKAATDADVLFYNGLNLEGGDAGWFHKMTDSVGQPDDKIFQVSEGVEPMYLQTEGEEGEINPHAFIDPAVGVQMAENMTKAFEKIDPDNKDFYAESGEKYVNRLKKINEEYEAKMKEVPKEDLKLVTSERAFQYLAKHFDLKEYFIWEIDTEENGSPKQIKTLVEQIKKDKVPVLFVESNVDKRPMETVSKETGVPIYKKPIYSDEIGKKGDEVDTYVKYLNYNLKVLGDGLTSKDK